MQAYQVHSSCEYLIPEEIRPEQSAVRVGRIVAVLDRHIRQVSQKHVVRVVLFPWVVNMSIILVDLVIPYDPLEEQEPVVVFVGPARSVEEDPHI